MKYISEPPREELLPAPKPRKLSERQISLIAGVILLLVCLYAGLVSAPSGPETDAIITVPRGSGLTAVANKLVSAHAIRSAFVFKTLLVLFGGSKGLQAGDYAFAAPQNSITVAWRLTHSQYELQNIRITVPEGLNSKEIADLFAKEPKFTKFDKALFIQEASRYEGYLFPDTYYFLPNIIALDVVDAMTINFQKRIRTVAADINASTRTITDIIKMASILEEEARTTETREIIAGILWKRLDEGMPLQVDSAFAFVNGKKKSSEISLADLAIDSPYNTYVHRGLPPTPISNPGLDSISAAVHPIKTKYYFYLSDNQGDMHYAVTLDEHVANKQKYLQ